MAAVADLTEEERYLVAILQDQSGIDIAEFSWTDDTSKDFIFRCYDYQVPWYRNRSKFQIDRCIGGDEPVLARRGHIPMRDIEVGDEVWTHAGKWREVTYKWDRGVQDVVTITGGGRTVVATPDHPFLRKDGTFGPAEVGGEWACTSGQVWRKIDSIEPAGQQHVYDIEVAEDHTFVVNGIVVSNCARAVGKSVGIQMRAFAFPFTNPGQEMLITAPELIHLDPVTKNIEERITSVRLGREFLKRSGNSNGFTHRPFGAEFRNGANIKGRIPQKDGKGVKGSLAAGALVTTPAGHLPIEKIGPGDLVLTHAGRFMPVLATYRYETDTVLVAGAGHRGIQVSANHRFFGRRNRNPQRTRNLERATWIPVDDPEMAKRWYWASPASLPRMDAPALPIETDERLFFWLVGRYVADGNLSGTNRCGEHTQISYTAHVDRLQEIEGIAELAGIRTARRAHDTAGCVTINSSAMAWWLEDEFGQHADGKRIPMWLHSKPKAVQESFLDGYLSGDGHYNAERDRWEMGTASKELAIGLRLMGQAHGRTTSFSWVDVKPNAMCANPLRPWRVQHSERSHAVFEDGFTWQKIRSCEPAGEAEVYDLVVAEDFSYVADGLVHRGTAFVDGDACTL